MKKKLSMWLLTFAVLCAFSALSFAQGTPPAGQNTTSEASSNVSVDKTNKKEKKQKKEKKPRKPRKTQKQK